MSNERYLLIVSQRYYQRHCFVAQIGNCKDDELLGKLQRMLEKLEKLKRRKIEKVEDEPIQYGDLQERTWHGWHDGLHYNVNDRGGDLYVYCVSSVGALAREYGRVAVEEYRAREYMTGDADMDQIEQELWTYHGKGTVLQIINTYFDTI